MASVEASNQASSDAILHDYEEKNISLIRLVKSLLATATMPHIVLIVVTSTTLYMLAGIDTFTVFSSLAFTSLAVAYAVTALLSSNKVVKRMITLDKKSIGRRAIVRCIKHNEIQNLSVPIGHCCDGISSYQLHHWGKWHVTRTE